MKKHSFIILSIIAVVFASCMLKTNKIRPFYDINGKHIGDSVFCKKLLHKVVFTDSFYIIDSMVYNRYSDNRIKSIYSFKNGNQIFENIDFNKNGSLKKYSFIDEDNSNYFYVREYDDYGNLVIKKGELFFQGYLDGIDDSLKMKKGKNMSIRIFYPNPPDCITNLYVKFSDTDIDVFYQNEYIRFLKTVGVSNNNETTDSKWNKINVWLSLRAQDMDSVYYYNKPIFYKTDG